jgi:hypothetical protein
MRAWLVLLYRKAQLELRSHHNSLKVLVNQEHQLGL